MIDLHDQQKALELRNCADLLRIVEERLGQLQQLAQLRDWERTKLAEAWDEVVSAKGLIHAMKEKT
jgi:hypothetical protein